MCGSSQIVSGLTARSQITYLIVADMLVATVITILQLLQHIVSLKLGAFVANCRLLTVSKPRFSMYPSQTPRRIPVALEPTSEDTADQEEEEATSADDRARPSIVTDQGKTTHTDICAGSLQTWN